MPELAAGFQSLPPEYQHIIRLAQDQHHITVTPLQTLAGGWSGALIYLVSVSPETGPVRHLVLKLDRKGKTARSDEISRHVTAHDQACAYYEECETLLRASGDKGDLARMVHSLGYIAQHEGDLVRAEAQFRDSLVMFRRLGNRRGMAECMAGLAGLRARQGQAAWGATLLSAAEACLRATGGAWWPADRLEVEANRQLLHEELDEPTFAAA